MDKIKRKSKSIEGRYDQSITCIESLSNELFHDIFDYLDVCEIFFAFSNLNQRFHQLLNSSSHLLKIRCFKEVVELYNDVCRDVVLSNKQQIYAIKLAMLPHIRPFLSSLMIDSSYSRLEALNNSTTSTISRKTTSD